MENKSEIILYQTEDGKTKIEVRLQDETVWLTLNQIVDLFQKAKSTISEHIYNVFAEGELEEQATVRNFRTVQTEGNRPVERELEFYNLDGYYSPPMACFHYSTEVRPDSYRDYEHTNYEFVVRIFVSLFVLRWGE